MGVATAVALGTTLASAGASAAQAAKQSRLQKQAEAEAQRAMQEARKRLEINFYDKLSVKKEPYELAIEAANVAAAGAMEAGRESERGVAATAGRVMMADAEQQRKIATAYGEELMNLEQMSAIEDSRLRDVNTQLDLGQAEGAQRAARDAQQAKTAATEAAVQSGISAVGQGIGAAALYGQNKGLQQGALGQTQLTPEQFSAFGDVKGGERFGLAPAGTPGLTSNLDLEVIGKLGRRDYNQFLKSLNATQRSALFGSESFQKNYNPFDYNSLKQ
jgi:hypothetical protein